MNASREPIRTWQLLGARQLLSAPPWVKVYQERVQLPGGRVVDDFYRVILPDFSTVVAVTADRQLVLVRGYKHGPRCVVLSTPSGRIEDVETPLAAAQRELLEETGYAAPE